MVVLKKYRERKGLSRREVADATNVDVSTVAKWETGAAYPRARQIPMLADLFDCSIDALFGREDAQRNTS